MPGTYLRKTNDKFELERLRGRLDYYIACEAVLRDNTFDLEIQQISSDNGNAMAIDTVAMTAQDLDRIEKALSNDNRITYDELANLSTIAEAGYAPKHHRKVSVGNHLLYGRQEDDFNEIGEVFDNDIVEVLGYKLAPTKPTDVMELKLSDSDNITVYKVRYFSGGRGISVEETRNLGTNNKANNIYSDLSIFYGLFHKQNNEFWARKNPGAFNPYLLGIQAYKQGLTFWDMLNYDFSRFSQQDFVFFQQGYNNGPGVRSSEMESVNDLTMSATTLGVTMIGSKNISGITAKGGSKGQLGSKTGYKFKDGVDVDLRGTGKTYNDALDDAFSKTGTPRSEFEVTKWGKDANGKSFPVEWRAKNGAEVNIDIGHTTNGPDVPHVGYQTGGKRGSGGAVRGHILVDDVPINR